MKVVTRLREYAERYPKLLGLIGFLEDNLLYLGKDLEASTTVILGF